MSFKRLRGIVQYLFGLSARLVARSKGLPEPQEAQGDRCHHVWITLKRQRFCRLCRRFERRVAKWRLVHKEDVCHVHRDGWRTGGWN